jgi:hypothetical protein
VRHLEGSFIHFEIEYINLKKKLNYNLNFNGAKKKIIIYLYYYFFSQDKLSKVLYKNKILRLLLKYVVLY